MTRVVAALAEIDGRLFLARRAPGREDSGTWELPGGKIEDGEGPFAALLRELHEELGVGAKLFSDEMYFDITHKAKDYQFIVFPVEFLSTPVLKGAHDAFALVEAEEIDKYKLAPFDAEAVEIWVASHEVSQSLRSSKKHKVT